MNASEPNLADLSPVELIYAAAEKVFTTVQGASHLDAVSDFVDSVRWEEPFIRLLIGFQFLLFLVTYVTRRRDSIQFMILLVITGIALSAEKLNGSGKRNWTKFAQQDYFDSKGLFMLTFLSGPFVVLANFIVVSIELFDLYEDPRSNGYSNIFHLSRFFYTDWDGLAACEIIRKTKAKGGSGAASAGAQR